MYFKLHVLTLLNSMRYIRSEASLMLQSLELKPLMSHSLFRSVYCELYNNSAILYNSHDETLGYIQRSDWV
jgi:hypothetical protein